MEESTYVFPFSTNKLSGACLGMRCFISSQALRSAEARGPLSRNHETIWIVLSEISLEAG